jgi:leader peptidase (prepilin peptidase) / N-methyltransferase
MGFGPAVDAAIAGVFGLAIGSFLNVVIYRLPRVLARGWLTNANEFIADAGMHRLVFGEPLPADAEAQAKERQARLDDLPPFSLVRPPSRCPSCGHGIRWFENVPVVSWLLLRGKCSACGTGISARYPIVEALTAGLFALCAYRWGLNLHAAAWCAFAAILVCQFLIDFDTQLLPEELNYPLLWLGLLASTLGWTVSPAQALWGAALGWFVLWSIAAGFKMLRGIEGMGVGDFKLLAALGAWFGAKYLVAIILMASVVGAVIGGILILVGRLKHKEVPMPFGPYLAGAGLLCLIVGPAQMPRLLPFAFPFGP